MYLITEWFNLLQLISLNTIESYLFTLSLSLLLGNDYTFSLRRFASSFFLLTLWRSNMHLIYGQEKKLFSLHHACDLLDSELQVAITIEALSYELFQLNCKLQVMS